MPTLLILKLSQSPACLNSTLPQYKSVSTTLTALQTQLLSTSLLLIGTISGKVSGFLIAETNDVRQVQGFLGEYVCSLGPWLLSWAHIGVVS